MSRYYDVDVEGIPETLGPEIANELPNLDSEEEINWEKIKNSVLEKHQLEESETQSKLTYEGDRLDIIFRPTTVVLRDYQSSYISTQDLEVLETAYKLTGESLNTEIPHYSP